MRVDYVLGNHNILKSKKQKKFAQYYEDVGFSVPPSDYYIPMKIGSEVILSVYGYSISHDGEVIVIGTGGGNEKLLITDKYLNLISSQKTNRHCHYINFLDDNIFVCVEYYNNLCRIFKDLIQHDVFPSGSSAHIYSNGKDEFILSNYENKIMKFAINQGDVVKLSEANAPYIYVGWYAGDGKYIGVVGNKLCIVDENLNTELIQYTSDTVEFNRVALDVNHKHGIVTIAYLKKIVLLDMSTFNVITTLNIPNDIATVPIGATVYLDDDKKIHFIGGDSYVIFSFDGNMIYQGNYIFINPANNCVKSNNFPLLSCKSSGSRVYGARLRTYI